MGAYEHQIVIDLEFNPTCGEAAANGLLSEIIEIGAVRIDSFGNVVDSYTRCVRPEHSDAVDPRITKLTGIRTSDVSDALPFSAALADFAAWIGCGKVRVVAWSKNDRAQIMAECAFKGIDVPRQMSRWLDLQVVYPRVMQVGNGRRRMSLCDAADWYGVSMDPSKAHRALYDAQVTAKMMSQLITGEYLKQKKILDELIPLRKKGQVKTLTASVGSVCAGLAELKAALLAETSPASSPRRAAVA